MYNLLLPILIVILASVGCDQTKAEAPKPPQTEQQSEQEAEQQKTEKPKTDTWCSDAYSDLEKMMEGLRATLKTSEKHTVKTPQKAAYLKTCATLPTHVQKCLVVAHAQTHMKECTDVEKQLDPSAAKTFKKLISGE